MFIPRKLIIDEENELFDTRSMKQISFPSDIGKIHEFTETILSDAPEEYLEGRLLHQQLSEIIKNGIKHGNKNDITKKIHIWFDLRKRARFVVQDEGAGFIRLEEWNDFFYRRQLALYKNDFDSFLELANYRGPESTAEDGGNSLIAALEYWNGGMIYNNARNKIGVMRWFNNGSVRK